MNSTEKEDGLGLCDCMMIGGVIQGWDEADLNGDGSVNMDDVIELKKCFDVNTPACIGSKSNIDGIGLVDMYDFGHLKSVFNCDAGGCNTRCVTDVYDSTARCAVGAASCACIEDQNNPGEVMTWDKVADYDGDALNVSPSDYVALFSGALESSPWTADHALADTNKDGSVDLDDVEPIKMLFGQCFDGSAECNGYGEYEYEHYCVKPAPDGALYDPDLPGNESLRSACPRWHNPAAGQFEFIRAKAADTNGDKKIGVADLALIKDKFLASTNINATPGFEKVDINRDGVSNLKDLMYMKRGNERCVVLQGMARINNILRCVVCDDDPGTPNIFLCSDLPWGTR